MEGTNVRHLRGEGRGQKARMFDIWGLRVRVLGVGDGVREMIFVVRREREMAFFIYLWRK